MSCHKSLAGPLFTPTGERRLLDPFISQVQEGLGQLYQKKAAILEAINCYRMSTEGGYDRVAPRVRLATAYLRRGQRKQAAVEGWRAMKLIPRELKRMNRRLGHRAGQAWRREISST